MELSLEKAKSEMTMMFDFEPLAGFKLIDRKCKGQFDTLDLLATISIEFGFRSFSFEETELFMKRYDY